MLLNLCARARQHGIKVLLLLTPFIGEPGQEYRNALPKVMETVIEETEGTLIFPEDLMLLPLHAFRGETHCTPAGADEFTRVTRQCIIECLATK